MVKIQRKRAFHSLMQQLDIFPRQAVQFRPVKENALCVLSTHSPAQPLLWGKLREMSGQQQGTPLSPIRETKVNAVEVLPLRSSSSSRGGGHAWCKCKMNPTKYQRLKGEGNRDPRRIRRGGI